MPTMRGLSHMIQTIRGACWPVLQRVIHTYGRFSRGMTLGVRGLVVNADGQILLIKHSYVNGWHLPGGGVETGETLCDALTRELAEEGGVSFDGEAPLFAIYFNSQASPRDHVALFVVRVFRQESQFRPNTEIVDRKFFSPHALPADTTAATRRRIAEVLDGAPIAAHW
jgi:ADP-ribose pyrophosphatase YjhB (NUDIX family)